MEPFYEGTGYSEQLLRVRPDPRQWLRVTPLLWAQIAAAGRCQHRQVQGETRGVTSDRKIWLSITGIPSGAWFATGKPVSSAGMGDKPVKCNKPFTEQFPDEKNYPKPTLI